MRATRLFVGVLLALQIAGYGLMAQAPLKELSLFKEDGWSVPGIGVDDDLKVFNMREINIEGKRIQVSSLKRDYRPQGRRPRVIKLPAVAKSDGSTRFVEEHFVVNRVDRYDIEGKAFCYFVVVSPATPEGNVFLSECYYAYFDEEGKGRFQTMEANILWLGGAPQGWQVRLPG